MTQNSANAQVPRLLDRLSTAELIRLRNLAEDRGEYERINRINHILEQRES